jgi:hypothetical protein
MVEKRVASAAFLKSRKFEISNFYSDFKSAAVATRFSALTKFIKSQNATRKNVTVIAFVDD